MFMLLLDASGVLAGTLWLLFVFFVLLFITAPGLFSGMSGIVACINV